MNKPLRQTVLALCLGWGWLEAQSQSFVDAFNQALTYDRTYLSAVAERNLGLQDANRAGLVYLPGASVENGRAPFETHSRTTYQVTQPLIDMDKLANYREMTGREAYTQATFAVKELDLARKIYKLVSQWVQLKEMESLALQEAQALDKQVQRAARRFELGSGSVIDVTTAQVQYTQAMARYQALQADITFAQQRYLSATGLQTVQIFVKPDYQRAASFELPQALIDRDVALSPTILQAKAQVEFAQLGLTRARNAYVPTVNAIYRTTHFNGAQDIYKGVQISMPTGLSAYSLSARQRAELDIQKAEAALAEAMEQVRLDSVSGGFSLKAYAKEMAYRSKAVEISQATVASTEKAYEAGVAKATDVVNAILASFDVQRQRLNLHMTLSEQSLSYQLSKGVKPADAMTLTQSLFTP